MLVFIPEHFVMRNFQIFAQTCLCAGVRFGCNQGRWIISQTYPSTYLYSDRIHWLHILYLNKEISAETDYTNALIFHENNKIIFEITRRIENGSRINAKFHNISLEDIKSITDYDSSNYHILSNEPLDLSTKSTAVLKSIASYSRKLSIRKKQMLPCNVCGKEFDRPSLLKRHTRTHTGERPHVCEVCGKGFSTSSSLNTHRRIHSGERPHQCSTCGKRFTASSNLYYHRLTHKAEKPHKCDVCGKSFPTPGNLRSHKYSHGGLSPFKCNVCSRVFTKLTNLKNHRTLQKH